MTISYQGPLILILFCAVSVVRSQYKLDDLCETEDGNVNGVCKYEEDCPNPLKSRDLNEHPLMCGFDDTGRGIVCCDEAAKSSTIPPKLSFRYNALYSDPYDTILVNNYLTCSYNGVLPMICCPRVVKSVEEEPRECEPLPAIRTPSFTKASHEIAWSKCVANERYVNMCVEDRGVYRRNYSCSISAESSRVAGGELAALKEFPHMAVLGCKNGIPSADNGIAWVAGGSLISDKYILTAAHATSSSDHGRIQYALLGALDKTKLNSGVLFHIIRIEFYKEYIPNLKPNDIALAELDRRVMFSEFIRPICLPVPAIAPQSEIRLVAGWGELGRKASTPNLLQKATISEVHAAECNFTKELKFFVWSDKTMICAKGLINRFGRATDTCTGDSGGPLMYRVTNDGYSCNYVIDGIVSWGNVCAEQIPSVYTRVSFYLDWIVSTVWADEYEV